MAERPVKSYNGDYITCYPGSNQHDDGKLNLEFNMARLVTRVSSKNFCIVKPSFTLTLIRSNKGFPQIQVGEGQCSINGRDLIMTEKLIIDAPEKPGHFYLALHLARDPHGNVFGDQILGVTKTFMGVYLTYFDEKPDPVTDPDILYLGSLDYDGKNITNLEEDPDKYGRIWAEDILAKFKDWKHPDVERMILQDWIYKVPDWYVSKEGDVIYGPLEFLAGRNPDIPGTPESHEDIGTGKYGIRAEATLNADGSRSAKIDIKGPDVDIDDNNKRLTILVNNDGLQATLGQSTLTSTINNNYALELNTPNDILVNSQHKVSIIGQSEISIGTGNNGQQPKLLLKDNKAIYSHSGSSDLKDEVEFNGDILKHTIGKSVFQYSNGDLNLLATDTNYFNIYPNTDFKKNIRVKDNIYLGNGASYGNEFSFLNKDELKLVTGNNSVDITNGHILLTNPTNNSGYITVKKDNTANSTLYNNGKLDLYNTSANPQILLRNGSAGYDITIQHKTGSNGAGSGTTSILDITAGHTKLSGDITATGDIRARRVYNAVYNDVAEYMEKANYDEIIEAGDIVCFTEDGKVTKVKNAQDAKRVAGIVSSEDTMGYVLGGEGLEDNQKVPVALVGRVWVKVDTPVNSGDFVTITATGSTNVSNTISAYTVGKATQAAKNGKVLVLVK